MKKFKKSLALAILVAFGLSFCGVFSDGAMAAKKTTTESYKQKKETRTTPTNTTSYSVKLTATIHGDIVAMWCKSKSELIYKTDDFHSSSFTKLNWTTSSGEKYDCETAANNISQELEANGVQVYNSGTMIDSYPPEYNGANGSKKESIFVYAHRYSTEADTGVPATVKLSDCSVKNLNQTCTKIKYESRGVSRDPSQEFTIYRGMAAVAEQLRNNHFEIDETPVEKEDNTDEDREAETERQKEEERKSKEIDGYDWKGNSTDDSDTTEDNQDPNVPKTMEYGDVDNKASILVGCDKAEQGGGEGIKCIINLVVDIMTVGVGILSVIGITVVGIQYLTSAGSEEKARKAKHRLFEIVIGVALYAVAYALLKWLLPSF